MADVTYQSLQSQIGQQKSQIQTSRETIQQQKIAGERGIQSLKRVHPRTKPGVYFGQIQPQIKTIEGQLVELKESEKELTVAEQKLTEQEQLLASKKAEGWKLRSKNGEIEFYKTTPVSPAVGGAPRGDFTVRLKWRTSTGEIKTVRGSASKLESMKQQIRDRGGTWLETESLGGGRQYRTAEMETTTGGSFILEKRELPVSTTVYERADPLLVVTGNVEKYISGTTPPSESYVPAYQPISGKPPGVTGTLRELTGQGEPDISTIAPTPVSIATVKAELIIKREGITNPVKIQAVFKQELRSQGYDLLIKDGETFVVKGTVESYEQKQQKFETTKSEIKRFMRGSPAERVAGLGLWASTGLLSHEDPFGIVSGYQAITGRPEKAIETKARAVIGLPIGEPWSPERFGFLGKAATGPLAMVAITYGVSAGLGAGVGAFEATTIGKYPLFISKTTRLVGGVAKPLITLTPSKLLEIGIGGYFGYKAVEQVAPIAVKAITTKDYDPLVGYLGSLGVYGYAGIKGYKTGKVFGYGRAEQYLYLRETYKPGTPEYIRFKSALKVARELYPIKPKHIKTLDLAKDIQKLSPKGVEAAYDVLLAKKRVMTLGGSGASYPQVRGARLARDVDFLISGLKRNVPIVKSKLKLHFPEEWKLYMQSQILKGKTPSTTAFLKKMGFDIHGKEFGYPGLYHRFGFLDKPRIKISIAKEGVVIGKFKALQASEQLFRKGVASVISERRYRWGEYPGFPKPPDLPGFVKGKKDIFDFVTTARSLITDAYHGALTKGRAVRAEISLELFLHPEKAPSYVKSIIPGKAKPFFWKSALKVSLPTEIPTVAVTYPTAYPIGTGFGYAPSVVPSEIPSYIPTAKISYPKYIAPSVIPSYIPSVKMEDTPYATAYKPSDFIPGYVPTYEPPYIPTTEPPYIPTAKPPYIPTTKIPYVPTYEPPYIPTTKPPYVPPYEPPYVPTIKPPYVPTYEPPYIPPAKPPYVPPPYEPPYFPPEEPPPEKKKRFGTEITYDIFDDTLGQGYNSEVRERHIFKGKKFKEGKFIKVNKKPLSLRNAQALMAMALDNSAAASGRVVPVDAMAQEPRINLIPFESLQHKFYKKGDVFIEKTKHRIDTPGEVKGISALGWYADKVKHTPVKTRTISRPPAKQKLGPRQKIRKQVDIFDMGNNMMIDMDKIFKGVFNFGIR